MQLEGWVLVLAAHDHSRLCVQGSSSSGILSLAQPHSLLQVGSHSGQPNTRDRNRELNILTQFEKGHCGEPSRVLDGPMHRVIQRKVSLNCLHLQKWEQPNAYLPFLSQSRFQIFNFGFIPQHLCLELLLSLVKSKFQNSVRKMATQHFSSPHVP